MKEAGSALVIRSAAPPASEERTGGGLVLGEALRCVASSDPFPHSHTPRFPPTEQRPSSVAFRASCFCCVTNRPRVHGSRRESVSLFHGVWPSGWEDLRLDVT